MKHENFFTWMCTRAIFLVTLIPFDVPSLSPVLAPSSSPTQITVLPSDSPSFSPSNAPSGSPSVFPTVATYSPTVSPTTGCCRLKQRPYGTFYSGVRSRVCFFLFL